MNTHMGTSKNSSHEISTEYLEMPIRMTASAGLESLSGRFSDCRWIATRQDTRGIDPMQLSCILYLVSRISYFVYTVPVTTSVLTPGITVQAPVVGFWV